MSFGKQTMSVPPEIIRVKRKRGEDTTPVAYLELQEATFESAEGTKRHCSGSGGGGEPRWVYQRRDIQAQASPHDIRPVIHSSRPEERGDFLNAQHSLQGAQGMVEERRQFYMSRSFLLASQESAAVHQGSSAGGGSPSAHVSQPSSKKRRYGTAVFIERSVKKTRQVGPNETTHHTGPDAALELPLAFRSKGADPGAQCSHPTPALQDQDQRLDVEVPEATPSSGTTTGELRKYKRPGRSSRMKRDSAGQAGEKEEGGESMTAAAASTRPLPQFRGDMEKLATEMDAWTLEQIDRNLARLDHEQEQHQQQQASKTLRSPPSARLHQQQQRGSAGQPGTRDALRFMPKAPAKRYAERHPEREQQPVAPATAAQGGDRAMEVDGTLDEEGDWVEIVYQRVPASKLDSTVPAKDIGVIILGDEEEKEFFYGADDDDSDAEKFEDEEDENAEDYYGADYPEDEVDSDDEYGYNPYQYRTGNASDEEQFGNDEFDYISGNDEDDDILDDDNDAAAIRKIHRFVSRHRALENQG